MRKQHILYIVAITILFSLIITIDNSYINDNNVSALDYSSNVGIGFTFNPTLSISLSSNDLIIPNLVPGSTLDSNSINVSVATNAAYGYTLSANVGDDIHNNSNLTHTNNTDIFSSIATNANLPSLDDSEDTNIWGCSIKFPNETAWSDYNGLPLYIDGGIQLVDANRPVQDTISFKVAAKASSAQTSGEYTNIINFMAVSKPNPQSITDLEYLQDFATISDTDLNNVKESMLLEHNYILKDQRDEQEYTVAKLADNKIWMTKSLNLAGGAKITSNLSDIQEGYTLPVDNGFQNENRLPASSSDFNDGTRAFVYNSNNNTSNCKNSFGCYSYYSWNAATAGSGVDSIEDGINVPYSICPKGWQMPTAGDGNKSSFGNLVSAYPNFYKLAGLGTPANFLLSGYIYHNQFRVMGEHGWYWSATSSGVGYAYVLFFLDGGQVSSNDTYLRQGGMPIRCLAR